MKPFQHFLYSLLFLFLALPAQAQQTLKVSAIPDESPTELLRKFKPLGAYLGKELGMKIDWTPVNDYPAVVEGLAAGKIDLAWLGYVALSLFKTQEAATLLLAMIAIVVAVDASARGCGAISAAPARES